MFREGNTEKLIEYLQSLPEKEQKVIVSSLSAEKPRKKLSKKEKKAQQVLSDIAAGLREIKEAKRTGKKLMTLDEALNEL